MAGVLQILKDNGFQCDGPSGGYPAINVVDEEDQNRLAVYRPFETPAPKRDQMKVDDTQLGTRLLFRYFLDGSVRTTNIGHVVDTKRHYLPIFIAQIGVAAAKLDDAQIAVETYAGKNIFSFPRPSQAETLRRFAT